ncbi:MAG: glycoside hydrolase family 20 zincin-like fold domain-containing protein, partial [Treponema sp.]|nr:glycoside hydrolase family 20 zincin-like fold domain-containing protein [Treponema sp.]
MLNLIPKPRSFSPAEGHVVFRGGPAVEIEGEVFRAEIDTVRGQLREIQGGLAEKGAAAFPRIRCLPLEDRPHDGGEEYYRLKISPGEITVRAGGGAGIYHGLQS